MKHSHFILKKKRILQKKNYLNGQREFDVVQALQTVFI